MSQTQVERLSRAVAARQAGRYAKALRELEDCEEWAPPENEAATLLRAGILTREAPVKALELLARMQDVMTSKEGRFGYYVASAQAYTATRNYAAAAAMIDLAQTLSNRVTSASQSLLYFHRALLRWCKQEFDPNDADVESLCSGSDPHGNFLGLELRGWMHAGLGRYDSQAQDLTAAVRVATAHPGICDPDMVARQIHALLRLGLERGDEIATGAGAAGYEALSWSDDMRSERFLCLRALAWTSFLRGESAQAQWLFKEAKSYAASDAWIVMAHLDRAYVARMNGNEPWAVEEALEAHRIARGVAWSATHGEERQALVMLAVLLAPVDMARAQRYVSAYMQMGKDSVSPMLALAQDRRAGAFEKYALGRVHQVLGNEALAIASFEAAFEVFSETGYRFRAALAATGLYETTGEERWREGARRAASVYPQSALCTMLNAQPCPIDVTPLRGLSPMERQVALALCEGLSVAQLSRRFSRSAFTINQIVDAVYKQLGTRNQAALRSMLSGWVAA